MDPISVVNKVLYTTSFKEQCLLYSNEERETHLDMHRM